MNGAAPVASTSDYVGAGGVPAGGLHSHRWAVAELRHFVRIPSISGQPERADDVRRCAEWLAGRLRAAGMGRVRVAPTARHPIVWAEWRGVPRRPTVLIYGHYDVQPVDPVSEWRSPPFAAEVRGGFLYGRGASDDKGQLFAHVAALATTLRERGVLPVNVVCVFEGEEEIGSPNLEAFLRAHREVLRPDVAVISDTRIVGPDQPSLTYALRGSISLELEVRGPERDLHSGAFGGAVHNPLQALCDLIGSLHDARGRVAVPGFYERVRTWSAEERVAMARAGPSDDRILRDARMPAPWGEPGYSLYERTTIRPALTVNGLTGGYQGPGGKSVIPAHASAKLNVRLAPDQEPAQIVKLLQRYIAARTPATARSRVRVFSATPPVLLPRDGPATRAAAVAYRAAFGRSPVFLRSGGSIPVASMLHRVLGVQPVLMGFALPDDGMHAPDERFHLSTFFRAIDTSRHFLEQIGCTRWPNPPD